LRLWCAQSATGQQPYSVAIPLKDSPDIPSDWRIDILATDLSRQVLERARAGRYTQFEIQRGLPIQLLLKYFEKDGDTWRITPNMSQMIRFQQMNLLHDFSHLGRFDIIFCRNVLIYFDQATRTDIIRRLAQNIEKDGF